jgi:hypothetical protein
MKDGNTGSRHKGRQQKLVFSSSDGADHPRWDARSELDDL